MCDVCPMLAGLDPPLSQLPKGLLASPTLTSALLDTLEEAVVIYDCGGYIVGGNQAGITLFGFAQPAGEAPSQQPAPAVELYTQDGQPLRPADWPAMRVLAGETLQGTRAMDVVARTPEGKERFLNISGAPVHDEVGNMIGAVVAVRDVTERHLLTEQRDEILRVVAHDTLTPVTGVRLYLQAQERRLRKGLPPYLPGEGHFDSLHASLQRMERLVNDLFEMARITSGAGDSPRRSCDLNALCHKEVEAQVALYPGRRIQLVLPEEQIVAEIDEPHIGRVITNFISNALTYSSSDRPVKLMLSADDGSAQILVVDQGPGIPAAELEHIWERFHHVKSINAHEGPLSLGLGLYICRAIVEQHGGRVGATSTVGLGSTFWFTLPLAQASARAEEAV
jgi:signal transduction histidine kinase